MTSDRLRTWRFVLLACAVGVATGLVLTWPLALHVRSHFLDDGTLDAFQFAWNLWWASESVFHLHTTPFFTRYLFFPTGTSLLFHTGSLSLGLLSTPLQHLVGLVVTQNVLVITAPALAVIFVGLLARDVVHDEWAALAGGLVVALDPLLRWTLPVLYLDCVWTIAALLWLWRRLQRVQTVASVVAVLAALGFVVFASQEYAMIAVAILALDTVARLVAPERSGLGRPWPRGTAFFWLITLLGLGSLAWRALGQPAEPPPAGQVLVASGYLEGFFVPPWLVEPFLRFDAVFYLGTIPILLAIVALARGGRTVVWWAFALSILLLMVMGPYLHVSAVAHTTPPGSTQPNGGVPGPYLLGLAVFPLLRFFRAPYRWMAGAWVVMGVVSAIGVASLRATSRRPRLVTGLVLLVVVIGGATDGRGLRSPLASTAVPPGYDRLPAEHRPGAILELPDGFAADGIGLMSSLYMYYQTRHRRPLLDGTVSRMAPGLELTIFRSFTDVSTMPWLEYVVLHRDLFDRALPSGRQHAERVVASLSSVADVVFDDGTFAVWRLRTFDPTSVPDVR
jgi:hypothetical protein